MIVKVELWKHFINGDYGIAIVMVFLFNFLSPFSFVNGGNLCSFCYAIMVVYH